MFFHFLKSKAIHCFSSAPPFPVTLQAGGRKGSLEEFVHSIYWENFLLGIAVWLELETRDLKL
ncbi:hypothetical protein Nmel_009566 [Mimus melanotis]